MTYGDIVKEAIKRGLSDEDIISRLVLHFRMKEQAAKILLKGIKDVL